jgi:hypothetical protein
MGSTNFGCGGLSRFDLFYELRFCGKQKHLHKLMKAIIMIALVSAVAVAIAMQFPSYYNAVTSNA